MTHLVGVLDDIGFAPEVRTDKGDSQIRLHHCPFLDLVEDHRWVVCPIHLGLMQGALDGLSSPVTIDRLDPFAQPDLCIAHLGPTDAA